MSAASRTMTARLINYQRISGRDSQVDIRHLEFVFPEEFAVVAPLYQPGDQITLHLPHPRVFAVASSQLEVRNAFHLTVRMNSVIEPDSLSYDELVDLIAKPIGFSVTPQPHFHLPADAKLPIILFAESVGIAPFRAFIQQRQWQMASGENWLFIGGQCYTEDFLYQTEWQRYERDEILTRVNVAFDDRVYMPSLAEKVDSLRIELWDWLRLGAVIYQSCSLACSDQLAMALLDLIREQGQFNAREAAEFLRHLKQNQRYQRMVYA
ncbi:MAG: hypothetical protein PHV54_10330 [Tolumonas sp.]|nr:hypothetical protein [Tolumonas sp.]